jgi:predicted cupin superfamily sugar epimerase
MLTGERPINYLLRLVPDDTHILIAGGPVDYFIFHADGRAEKITLGMNLAGNGRLWQYGAGAGRRCGCAMANYALMANALSPELPADRVKIGEGEESVKRFAESAQWATPAMLRELIGSNFEK